MLHILNYLHRLVGQSRGQRRRVRPILSVGDGLTPPRPSPLMLAPRLRAPAAALRRPSTAAPLPFPPKRIDILPPSLPSPPTDADARSKQLCSWKHPPSRLRAKCRFPPASSGAVLRSRQRRKPPHTLGRPNQVPWGNFQSEWGAEGDYRVA